MKENGLKLAKERSRIYPAQTITDADYNDDITLPPNTPTQAKSLLPILERPAGGIGLHVNADQTEFMTFNQRNDISTLKGGPLKLVDKFTYLGSCILSTETEINLWLMKVWAVIENYWKSDLTDKIKQIFFK